MNAADIDRAAWAINRRQLKRIDSAYEDRERAERSAFALYLPFAVFTTVGVFVYLDDHLLSAGFVAWTAMLIAAMVRDLKTAGREFREKRECAHADARAEIDALAARQSADTAQGRGVERGS